MYTNEQTEPDRLDKLLAAVFEELVTGVEFYLFFSSFFIHKLVSNASKFLPNLFLGINDILGGIVE